ncbi:hypothetical protein [Bifidobacterium tissieri]|uniref:Uncharacterized protein n=1 Tax=Bifidobacterium tissieri TaxID=1630162 RepID=A0A5M9ZS24_9BIFI|nr:hypothetical protein [Bifidobacterium tissieri]KAA8830113.1 hypothetical protein EMO89_06925 [Bifidobacterium tissieri]KAA8830943.1 hypothetical protein EM849_08750 [Bifidobacterium tissieri]
MSSSDKQPDTNPYIDMHKQIPDENTDDFTPTFSRKTRTIVYLICMAMGIVAYTLTVVTSAFDAPAWLTVTCATFTAVPGYIAAAFGVHYNGIAR